MSCKLDDVPLHVLEVTCKLIRIQESKMSGRVLRRMPLMAHVRYMSGHSDTARARSAERWLGAMSRFVEAEQKDRAMIGLDKAGMSLDDEKRVKDEE